MAGSPVPKKKTIYPPGWRGAKKYFWAKDFFICTWYRSHMDSLLSSTLDQILKLEKGKIAKQQEIDKRREVLQKHLESEVTKKKVEAKKDKLTNKEFAERQAIQSKIEYYRKEIKAAEEKFESYRTYCLSQIALCEQKSEAKLNEIDTIKQTLEDPVLDEDNDKILTRLKIELAQFDDNIAERKRAYALYEAEHKRMMEARAFEERMRVKMELNQKAAQEAWERQEACRKALNESFYKEESSEEEETIKKPDSAVQAQRKAVRKEFRASAVWTQLTPEEQQKFKEISFEDQDAICTMVTLREIQRALKKMKVAYQDDMD